MNIAKQEKFYEQNKKEYELLKNKKLLSWINKSITNGYHPILNIEQLQELINNISYWYEIKYPEREFEFYEGIRNIDFENIESLSKLMSLKQLMFRLTKRQLLFMKANYRSNGGYIQDIYNDNNEIIGQKNMTVVKT